jgi:hypothetical protein
MKKVTITECLQAISQKFLQKVWPSAIFLWLIFISLFSNQVSAQSGCSMACANANIGIADQCIAYVSPLSVAKINFTGCDPQSWVIYIRETMNGPVIASGTIANPAELDGLHYLNRTLVAEVVDGASGNKCWAFIVIEDKTAPQITCEDLTLECDEMLDYEPEARDNCSVVSLIRIDETKRNANCNTRTGIAVINNGFGFWEPGASANQNAAFNDLFGAGNWNLFNYNVSPAQIFNNNYGFVYLDGGNENAILFAQFLDDNRSLIQNWVSQGGALFLNASPNIGGDIDLGFGGVILRFDLFSTFGTFGEAVDASHPIFQGPATPANGPYSGNYFNHSIICPPGMNARAILRNPGTNADVLVEMPYGQGIVHFGGMTSTNYHDPDPNADNMRRNIYHYLYANRNEYARGITSVVTQTWVAVDHVGMRDTCTVQISVRRPNLQLVECPDDEVTLSCSGTWERDANGNPHPSETGYPTYNGEELDPAKASRYCNLLVGYEDLNLPGFCQGERKIMRQWRVSEWYCGEDFDRVCTQVIVLKDTESPQIVCPPTREVSTSANACAQHIFIDRPVVSDNCSPQGSIVVDLMFGNQFIPGFQGGMVSGFQPGINVITFRVYDNCGNSSSCTQSIVVRDLIAPIAICRTFTTASLGTDGTARVSWQSFDDGSYDNCSVQRIEVRRMDENSCDLEDDFKPFVQVCCTDVTGSEVPPVMVVLRVVDQSNNSNTCMVSLEVQDKLPAQILCPPDVTVNCGFDLSDLSVFGKVADLNRNESRDSIFINGQFIGLDGYAYDNCDVFIENSSDTDLTVCGAGLVVRTFTAEGFGNNKVAECQQRIRVINNVNYLPQTIVWPCDIMVTNFCTENPASDLSPNVLRTLTQGVEVTKCPGNRLQNRFYDRPQYQDDECTQVGVSYKDHVFEIQDSACYKVLREWKIIDWCAMEQNPGHPIAHYTYHHIQIIKIKNTVAPVITCDRPQEVCSFQTDCSVGEVLTVSATATDDCTREEDLYWRWEYFANNGNQVTLSGNTRTITRNFPVGTHRIRFLVEDKCGNTDACTTTVTVRDCKQPTPICHHLVIDLMVTGMVNINAVTFNAGSYDNCTPRPDLTYRIERTPFTTPGTVPPGSAGSFATFTCDDLGLNDVRIWVGDEDGNWDFCETTLIVQNNAGANCLGNSGGIIAGLLKTENREGVEDAEVYLQGQNTGMYKTNEEGKFTFNNLSFGTSFDILPMRLDEPANGVSTMDILKIQRHILGIEALNSPYKIIAADVNLSGVVTGADLVEMRRLILGTIDEFSQAPSWKFIPQDYAFFDPQDPLKENFPEKLQVLNFQGQIPKVEFVAVKMGDVNESVRANSTQLQGGQSREQAALILEAQDVILTPGQSYEVVFRSQDFRQIFGYQFTLGVNADVLELIDIREGALDVNAEHFGMRYMNDGFITTSWNSREAVSTTSEEALFTLVFKAKSNSKLSDVLRINSAITQAEAYGDLEGPARNVQLVFNDVPGLSVATFELFQNRPNPFSGNTLIGFQLPEAGEASMTVYDVTGRMIHEIRGQFAKGYNEVELSSSVLQGVSGVMYYELKTNNASAVKKMVRLN